MGSPHRAHIALNSPRQHNLIDDRGSQERLYQESGRKVISKRILYNQMKPEDIEKYLQSQREITNSPKISNLTLQPIQSQELQGQSHLQSRQPSVINPFSHSHTTFVNLQNLHTESQQVGEQYGQSNLAGQISSSTLTVSQPHNVASSQAKQIQTSISSPLNFDHSAQYPSLNPMIQQDTNRSGPNPNLPTSFSPPRGQHTSRRETNQDEFKLPATPQPSKVVAKNSNNNRESSEIQKTVVKKVTGKIDEEKWGQEKS